MTTLKTEIFRCSGLSQSIQYYFETLYAGNQNFVYKFNGTVVEPEAFFMLKNYFAENLIQIK